MMILAALAACLAGAPNAGSPVQAAPSAPVAQAAPAPLPLASLDDTLDVSGDAMSAREIRSRLTLPVTVNGTGPFRFLVDSGADRSVVGRRLSDTLGLLPQHCLRLHGTAGTTLVPAVRVRSLRVGNGALENLLLPALPDAAIGADGVLGIDALAGQRLKLDFEARTITLEDARRREAITGEAGDIVVTARRQRGQLILAAASSAGTRMLAVIDTGAEVTVGNAALRARIVGRNGGGGEQITLIGVTGDQITADLVIVPELTIGGLGFRNVPIAFTDAPPFALFGLTETPAVLLGTDVLQAFRRVTLDFRRRKVRFSLRAGARRR
jgi:hypothetical protein